MAANANPLSRLSPVFIFFQLKTVGHKPIVGSLSVWFGLVIWLGLVCLPCDILSLPLSEQKHYFD